MWRLLIHTRACYRRWDRQLGWQHRWCWVQRWGLLVCWHLRRGWLRRSRGCTATHGRLQHTLRTMIKKQCVGRHTPEVCTYLKNCLIYNLV